MSTFENLEKWLVDNDKTKLNEWRSHMVKEAFIGGWQTATAESENRIAELEQRALEESNKYVAYCDLAEEKIAELKANTSQIVQAVSRAADAREAVMENEILELKKHINVLREALGSLYPGLVLDLRYADKEDDDLDAMQSRIDTVQEALASTAAQSLQAHDNELIESAATVARMYAAERHEQAVVEAIRALKGK